eukprot:TRINITY_DN1310_c0_g1_i1.p1 TRINITY_DN1310_c0_g1~~TRINITY_DN1310_c0_g1_i1.p1  ORF type:complete len:217 (-),score=58.52 TRINITY_DN1310_c0_g1_i1:86-736(-)
MAIHGFRYALVAQQIISAKQFCLVDFSVANSFHSSILSIPEDQWAHQLEYYTKKKDELVHQVFPASIPMDNFLDSSLPPQVALLQRANQFPAYQGQEKFILLDGIRLGTLREEEVLSYVPLLYTTYRDIKNSYELLCQTIQDTYLQLKQLAGEQWEQKEHYSRIIEQKGGKWKSILFYMKANNIELITELFKREDKKKQLEVFLFHSKKKLQFLSK